MSDLKPIDTVAFGKNHLHLDSTATVDEWLEVGQTLSTMQGAIQWWIGDWLNYGESRYGEAYTQALDSSKYTYQALADMKYVASKIGISSRNENLSWTHHKVLAPLSEDNRDAFITKAVEENLSASSLRKAVNGEKKECECTIQDMEKTIIHEYKCEHGKVIREIAE